MRSRFLLIAVTIIALFSVFVGTSFADPNPDATIVLGPANGSTVFSTRTPSFVFSGNADAASFECSVDGGNFAACTSAFVTASLVDGPHTFAVRALDSGGIPESTPDSRSFTVLYGSAASFQDGVLDYSAIPGETNSVSVLSAESTYIRIADANNPVHASTGCTAMTPQEVRCSVGATNPPSTASLGDGNDVYTDSIGLASTVNAGDGNDVLNAGGGADVINAGAGNDTMDGGLGADSFNGGTGIDTATYATRTQNLIIQINGSPSDGAPNEGDDVETDVENVIGGSGNDTINGSAADNTINGGPGNDQMAGNGNTDTVYGDAGNDTVTVGASDVMHGGSGTDTASFTYTSSNLNISLDGVANDTNGMNAGTDVENIAGGSGNDTLTGNASDNSLVGGAGNDVLSGVGGNDSLNGGLGADTFNGGSGLDTATYAARTEHLTVQINGNADDGASNENDDVETDVENVIGGSGNDTILGSSEDNTISGGAGNDDLGGNGNADVINGDAGNDIVIIGASDTVNGGSGTDTVTVFYSPSDMTVSLDGIANDTNQMNPGTDVENVTGGNGNDTLIGNSSANVIEGGPGSDAVSALGGNDTVLVRDKTVDQVDCSSGTDTVTGDATDVLTGCETANLPSPATITGGPAEGSTTDDTTPEFSFTAAAPATFDCRVDGGAWVSPCASPWSSPTLAEGPHTFSVRAIDSVGDVDDTPVTRSFTVAAIPPDTDITSGPSEGSKTLDTTPTFTFSTDSGTGYECELNNGGFSACNTPYTTAILGDGAHTLRVRATRSGLVDASPAVRNFVVDSVVPTVTITSPISLTTDQTPALAFTASDSEGIASTVCSIDSGTPAPCTSGSDLATLSDGVHTIQVTAHDEAGNAGAALEQFAVDTSDPDVLVENDALVVSTNAGLSSAILVSLVGGEYLVEDGNPLKAGPRCTQATMMSVSCEAVGSIATATVSTFDMNDDIALDGVSLSTSIDAGSGDDAVFGGDGVDAINGGSGDDQLRGEGAVDSIDGGAGADVVLTRDGLADVVDCGSESDTSLSDQYDEPLNCESITQAGVVANIGAFSPMGPEIVRFLAADGDVNNVSQTHQGGNIIVEDSETELVAGPGCVQVNINTASCDDNSVAGFWAILGDLDDEVELESSAALSAGILAGSGNDLITGGAGRDSYTDEAGNDTFHGGDGESDDVFYLLRAESVDVSLDGQPNDGPGAETDNIHPDVERLYGSEHSDNLVGSDGADFFYGGGGDDVIEGLAGDDAAYAGPGNDTFDGGADADEFHGDSGLDTMDYSDRTEDLTIIEFQPSGAPGEGDIFDNAVERILGGTGNDQINTDSADNVIDPGPGEDTVTSEMGSDTILARDNEPDSINCGDDPDSVAGDSTIDSIDASCESVDVSPTALIETGPADNSTVFDSIVEFTFTSDDAAATFECRWDAENFAPCDSPFSSTSLPNGEHQFVVRAVDPVGGFPSESVTRTFNVDAEVIEPNVYLNGNEMVVNLFSSAANDVSLTRAHGKYVLSAESGLLIAGALCSQTESDQVSCPAVDVNSISINGGAQSDRIELSKRIAVPAALSGGAGSDEMIGGSGNDAISGGFGDDSLRGAAGADSIDGNEGVDTSDVVDGEADTVMCDEVADQVTSDVRDSMIDCALNETVSVVASLPNSSWPSNNEFLYLAAPGQENEIVARATTRTATLTDTSSSVFAGTGCEQVGFAQVDCASQGVAGVRAELGDGNDRITIRGTSVLSNVVLAAEGDDFVENRGGTSELQGGVGADRLVGGTGIDSLIAGDGDDSLSGGTGSDIFNGGDGSDLLDYSDAVDDVNVSLEPGAFQNGGEGEFDAVVDSFEKLSTGVGDDVILGNDVANEIDPGPGADFVNGGASVDSIEVRDGEADEVTCGIDVDEITADTLDVVGAECLLVDRAANLDISINPSQGSLVSSSTPSFEFASDAASATFECKLDSGVWEACVSPLAAPLLTDGLHQFELRAIGAGSTVLASSTRDFTVDTVAPDATITDGPAPDSEIGDQSPEFSFMSTDPTAEFQCRLSTADDDERPFFGCKSPYLAGLGNDDYVFDVRAVDAAGNTGTPVSLEFSVSSAAIVEFDEAPLNGESFLATPPVFEFSSDDSTNFECSIDGGNFSPCASPYVFDSPVQGERTFAVRAIDVFGLAGPVIKRTVIFEEGDLPDDAGPPKTILDSGPDNDSTLSVEPVFEFSSNEAGTFLCRVDGADWDDCESPWTPVNLQPGDHEVEIGAKDNAENFTDRVISRRFAYLPLEAADATIPEPIDRETGLTPTVDFALGTRAALHVDIRSGYMQLKTDDIVPTEDGSNLLAQSRLYSSAVEPSTVGLGNRWSFGFGPRVYLVEKQNATDVEIHGLDDEVATFWQDDEDPTEFTTPAGMGASLHRTSAGGFELERDAEGDVLQFDSSGQLTGVINAIDQEAMITNVDLNGITSFGSIGFDGGDTVAATYDQDNRVTQLAHSAPLPPVVYGYGTGGELSEVTYQGSTVEYGYDENGYLNFIEEPGVVTASIDLNMAGQVEVVTVTEVGGDPVTKAFYYAPDETTISAEGLSRVYPTNLGDAEMEDPELRDERADALAASNGMTIAEADAAAEAMTRTDQLSDALRIQLGEDFAGVWHDVDGTGKVIAQVGPNGSVAEAQKVVDAFEVTEFTEVRQVGFSAGELSLAAAQLRSALESVAQTGRIRIQVEANLNRVVALTSTEITPSEELLVTTAVSSLGGAGVVRASGLPTLAGEPTKCVRGSGNDLELVLFAGCKRPLRGGIGISTPDNGCSAGFVGSIGKVKSLLTAGHCLWGANKAANNSASKPTTWRAHSSPRSLKPSLGKSAYRYQYGSTYGGRGDAGAIKISGSYWKQRTPAAAVIGSKSDSRKISGVRNLKYGESGVCIAGARSGYHCNGQVVASHVDVPYLDREDNFQSHLYGLVAVRFPECKGSIPGDSGGPVFVGRQAVGVISGSANSNYELGCVTFVQPLLDNCSIESGSNPDVCAEGGAVERGATSIVRFCVKVTGSKKKVCSNSKTIGSKAAIVRSAPPTSSTNGKPAFFVNPRGAKTKVKVQFSNSPTGDSVTHETKSMAAGEGFDETQVSADSYASCEAENHGKYVRIMARNVNGVRVTDWVLLPPSCNFVSVGKTGGADLSWVLHSLPTYAKPVDVSCPTTTYCGLLVSTLERENYLLEFNGETWSEPVEIRPNALLMRLTCTATQTCFVVGYSGTITAHSGGNTSIVFSDSGFNSPDGMMGIDCADEFCISVGTYGYYIRTGSNAGAALVGASNVWAPHLYDVSCVSDNFCLAVGWEVPFATSNGRGTYYMYDGNYWTGGGNEGTPSLSRVECMTTTECLAIDSGGQLFMGSFGGWDQESHPLTGAIMAIDCPSAGYCRIVDDQGSTATYSNGTWSAPSTIVRPDSTRWHTGLSCADATLCVGLLNNVWPDTGGGPPS